ncbi:MAG: ArsR/SmtB family transcription factor [Vulcanococcus sp.]
MALAAEQLPLDQLQGLLKALSDPRRLELAMALAEGERCVCELTEELGFAQSKLSFHLKVMRQAGLLEAREQGRWVYYRLRPEALAAVSSWLGALKERCGRSARSCC